MAIRVLISRRVPVELVGNLKPLLLKLRSLAMGQPGYISGETLINADDKDDFLVLSSWATVDEWVEWQKNPTRVSVEQQIEHLLGSETGYRIYSHV